ncbi:hypothetical protein O1611_g8760 [Lasiodiplodia mahajangana]|uniref:Uncharacterized protein n=1 Tax=Lasiodiplodia mahajangana TaxID=1108764 RepID=A0ACC2JBM6_9PEZI|nr:hypothetical protein O1611_g8760 [Lasiodiplodia mahajangana]
MAWFDPKMIALLRLNGYPALILLSILLLAFSLYRRIKPKPIPGIPYNKLSSQRILGDVPDFLSHVERTNGTIITFLLERLQSLNAPLVQVFLSPVDKPLLILADYRETVEVLRRKEFDRSTRAAGLLKGLGPAHHIRQRTNSIWRAQRFLIKDLMTPTFLHGVAGPILYQSCLSLIDLWRVKSRIAGERHWVASEDLDLAVLDAVIGFTFGAGCVHNAIEPALRRLKDLDTEAIEKLKAHDRAIKKAVEFPDPGLDEVLYSCVQVMQSIMEVQGSIWPSLHWEYVAQKPRVKKARKVKDEFILRELKDAVDRMESGVDREKSAVDNMVRRAKIIAEKEGRAPDYFSRVMIDEAFGFIVAGQDTTSTALSWGVKLLADNPSVQTKLRNTSQAVYTKALQEQRNPTKDEIVNVPNPYLDATIEEILRTGGVVPMIDREAIVDTQILGHHVPKGTGILCLTQGPSFMSPAFNIDEGRRSVSSQEVRKDLRVSPWDHTDIGVFQPERWLGAGDSFDPAAGPCLAFSTGLRQCYGKRLAYLEMKVLLELIIWNFELLPCPDELSKYTSVMHMTSRPRNCYVRLREVELSG